VVFYPFWVFTRWMIFVPVAVLAWFSAPVNAIDEGLTAIGYKITSIPPSMDDETYEVCGETVYSQINWTWDYEQNLLGTCGWDLFMVHYFGSITFPPETTSVRFAVASDDGGYVDIDGVGFGSWFDHGCDVFYSDRVELASGTALPIDAWFYENGGGTCFMLFWQLNGDNQDWEIVPMSAFSSGVPPTTTVEETTTTVQETTTVPESTTTVEETTTTVEETTTTVQETTTTVQETTTTVVDTTTTVVETTFPETTQTTIIVETTTVPETTVPETIPDAVVPETSLPDPDNVPAPDEILALVADGNLSDREVSEIVDALDSGELSDDEVMQVIEAVLATDLSSAQATELAMSSTVLANVTSEQANQIFDAVNPSEISKGEADAIVKALENAPKAVKKAFEGKVNVFAGVFDSYVPTGSKISVGERRVIVAVSGVLVASSNAIGAVGSSSGSSSADASRRRK
jgi:hypothetical protein